MVVNLSQEGIFPPKGHMMGHLEPTSISVEEITTETSFIQTEVPEEILKDETIPLEKKFITSPADVERHRKVELPDAEVSEKHKKQFAALCERYDDIFSKGSADIGKTPLITISKLSVPTMETTGASTDPDKIASDAAEETVDLTTTPTGPSMEATERSINTNIAPGTQRTTYALNTLQAKVTRNFTECSTE